SRAIARRRVDRRLDNLWLDATSIDDLAHRFPTICAHCRDAGLDPTRESPPVAPAAHYLRRGAVTHIAGAASLPGSLSWGGAACAPRSPPIWAPCPGAGRGSVREWLRVAPAAHYLCGGVVTDSDGAAPLPGLWACGEVACTGIHGANRLASNSLLEGLVFGHRV